MKKKNYFEGWYFKEQTKEITIAFIPEISYDEEGNKSGSLQLVMEDRTYFIECKSPMVMNMKNSIYVVMDKNVFTDEGMHIDIDNEQIKIKGEIYFDQVSASFDVMGVLKHFPMPCKHTITAMEQKLTGKLNINDIDFDFDQGKGYLEGDYGHSFPRTYLWSQCNWFNEEDCQISMAAAAIPIHKHKVMGTYVCISFQGKQYKLATYKGAEVSEMTPHGVKISQGAYIFEGQHKEGSAVELRSPVNGRMEDKTKEYLCCTMEYRLTKKGKEIFSLVSKKASFEYR